ncbi:MAG: adenosine-specific kinase [Candidatus Scalindua sp.]
MEFEKVKMETPEGANIIIGQTHFIKTVEVVIAETELGRGITGVIDGVPKGTEEDKDIDAERRSYVN